MFSLGLAIGGIFEAATLTLFVVAEDD